MVEKNHMLEQIKKAKNGNGNIKVSQKDLIMGLWQDFLEFRENCHENRLYFEKRTSYNRATIAVMGVLLTAIFIKLIIG